MLIPPLYVYKSNMSNVKPNKPLPGKSLAEKRPDLLSEYSENNKYSPWAVGVGTTYEALWVCHIHGEYTMPCNRYVRGQRCKECRNGKLSTPPPEKSLGYLYPEIAATWSPKNTKTPYEVYAGSSNKKYLWICESCGEEYKMTCAKRSAGQMHRKCRDKLTGLKNSLPKPFHSFGDLYPELLKEYSPENSRNPYSLNIGSDYLVTWLCKKGHTWRTYVYNRTGPKKTRCPECKEWGTSNTEQHLRTSLLPYGASPSPQTKLGKWSVDIYIPESKTVIEYDGSAWHHTDESYERDRRKSLELLQEGYRVIRVRTQSSRFRLESLNIENENYFEVFCEEPKDSIPSQGLLTELTNILCNF